MRKNTLPDGQFVISLFIGVALLAILFLAFSWGNQMIKDARLAREMENFKRENARIARENAKLRADFEYFSSPQYRDKWAKEHDGLAQPGEKVIVIEFAAAGVADDLEKDRALLKKEILLARPNREQWKIFFFGEK